MTTGQGNAAPPAGGEGFASAWRELRRDSDIQFAPVERPQEEPPPDWLTQFIEWLGELLSTPIAAVAEAWPVLRWVLLGIVLLIVAWYVYDNLIPSARRKSADEDEWSPRREEAVALLEEADRLAAAGQYDKATHLLLQRSVDQIRQARPDLVEPSSTARELAAEQRLPEAARQAFALIAAPVERSLFALRRLEQKDWHEARAAYADFARVEPTLGAPESIARGSIA